MPIHSDTNLYPGINPHLNSFLQKPGGGWKGFHNIHLADMARMLEDLLPDTYYTANEQSLQIGTYDPETEERLGKPESTVPDITVYRTGAVGTQPQSAPHAATPTLTLPLTDRLLVEEEYVSSLVIYRMEEGLFPGKPVTRIELLSPANKPLGSYYGMYLSKRAETLESGLRLIEIDYLHESRPVIPGVPSYPDRHPRAYPYSIIVNDPRPTILEGKTDVYGIGVLAVLPVIDIPLDGTDTIKVDFGVMYNRTFESSRLFRLLADYQQEPANFQAYSEADQELIRQHMAEIKANHP